MQQPATDNMADDTTDRPLHLVPTCMHLRHKLMYVDVRHMTRGLVDDSSTTRQFWCQRSQDARGVDGAGVDPSACGSGRPCFHGRPQPASVASRTPSVDAPPHA